MIKTRVVHHAQEIQALLPHCNELMRRANGCLPFHRLEVPLLWWKHFGGNASLDFGQRRGRNFLGAQSWVKELHLLVAEEEGALCGVVPLVSTLVKMAGMKEKIRVLSFAGDSVLIAYQDFLVLPGSRPAAVNALFDAMLALAQQKHDVLFLGYIPEDSPNLPPLRERLAQCLQNGWRGGETLNRRRGGVQPWTIASFLYQCKALREKLDQAHAAQPRLEEMIARLAELKPEMLLFPKTRLGMENTLREILLQIKDETHAGKELAAISELLNPAAIPYPYVKLPKNREAYFKQLSHDTRRYFRRYGERFREKGGQFEKITRPALTNQDIDDYLHLHSLRWQSDSAAVNDRSVEFHRDLAFTLSEADSFCLWFARHDGRRVATHSCLDTHPRREGYFTGRDPVSEELRAGRLLYLETILDAIDQGFSVYDLGYGGDAYKMSFADSIASVHHIVLSSAGKTIDLEKLFPKYEYIHLD
jgi:hypothetical protein